jgi:mono/diheme cytochrome c family protein
MTSKMRFIFPLFLFLSAALSACGGLAGEPDIVATLPSAADVQPDLTNGAQLYAANCVKCHGASGDGRGEMVLTNQVGAMPSFRDAAHVSAQTPQTYFSIITNGNLEKLMPPWKDALTEQERWDVAYYVYSLHTTPEALGLSGAESTVEPLPDSVTFTGTVTNKTANGKVPADLQIALRYGKIDEPENFQMVTASLNADNSFTFADLPTDKDFIYFAFTVYQGRNFTSDPITADQLHADMTLPLTIYELTEDPSVVTIKRIDAEVQPHNVENLGTGIVFIQRITYENTSDRMFTLPQQIGNAYASIVLQLPPGAIILSMDNATRYVVSEERGIIADTLPVLPGEHTVNVIFFLPYTDGAVIDQSYFNAIQGEMHIGLTPKTLIIPDERFVLQASEAPEDEALNIYVAQLDVPFNESLTYEIRGLAIPQRTSQNPQLITADALIPLLLVTVLAGIALFGVVLIVNRGRGKESEIQALIRQIAELDTRHNAGQLNHDVYQRQRQELKTRLAQRMAAAKSSKSPDSSTNAPEGTEGNS